jgi:3-deoxy-D-manno-octulosonate 8-phosphate phosphatase (KDO 8-P phosphatase)
MDFPSRARRLRLLLFDVDGVLTDGRLYYGTSGEEIQAFDVKDGLGFKLAHQAGLETGLLSSRGSAATERRARELGIDRVMLRRGDKAAAFTELLAAAGLDASQVAYTGDDLPDLPVLLRVGLSFAPADAAAAVRSRVAVVLTATGGHGAGREVVERVLAARGEWDPLLAQFRP